MSIKLPLLALMVSLWIWVPIPINPTVLLWLIMRLNPKDQASWCSCKPSPLLTIQWYITKNFDRSFDVTSLPCGSPGDAQTLVNLVQTYYNHPNQFNYKGKTFVALFSGNYCSFGQGSPLNAWNYFRGLLTAKGISIYLAPSIFDDPSTFSGSNNWFDGHLGWDSAWPMGGSNLDGSFDNQQMSALTPQGKGYIAGVSPCFFTHYSPSSWNKNWIYRSDNWLLATRMEML